MSDSDESAEPTEWTTISIPRDARDQVRDSYERNRDDVYLGTPEPLWAYILRATSRLDDDGGDE
jgi:hypothetical protein